MPKSQPRISKKGATAPTPQAAVSVWSDRRITIFLTPKQIQELHEKFPYQPRSGRQVACKLQGELKPTRLASPHAAAYRCDLHISQAPAQLPLDEDDTVPFPPECGGAENVG